LRRIPVVAAALLLALTASLTAQAAGRAASASPPASSPVPEGPAWSQLTEAQRQALAPLNLEWNRLDGLRKSKWLEIASRFPQMSADERQRLHERMAAWARLTPAERTVARINFQQSRDLPKQERQARWEAYQALPADQKAALARRAVGASAPASAVARPKPAAPLDLVQPKSNLVRSVNPVVAAPSAVAPAVVQARPGATTTLLGRQPTAPTHQPTGQPKIAVGPNAIDATTLLPRQGPQAPPLKPLSQPQRPTAPTAPSAPSVPLPQPASGGTPGSVSAPASASPATALAEPSPSTPATPAALRP